MVEELTAEGVVLRCRPYSETSLLVAMLTRDAGLLHVVVRGGARRSKGGRDVIDLWRVVQVRWRPSRSSDLHTARSLEVTETFEQVARNPAYFEMVGWLSRLLLSHGESGGEQELAYAAFLGMLRRMRDGQGPTPAAIWTSFILALTKEEGVLPPQSPEHERRIGEIIAAICDADQAFPEYDSATWLRLRDWCAGVLVGAGMPLADGWQRFGTEV